jgi:hypothetical protein
MLFLKDAAYLTNLKAKIDELNEIVHWKGTKISKQTYEKVANSNH